VNKPVVIQAGRVTLAVESVEKSVDFYRSSFGFSVEQRFDDPPYATVSLGPLRLSVAEVGYEIPDLAGTRMTVGAGPRTSAAMVVLEVDDARRVWDDLRRAGVETLSDPWEPPWGGCRFFVADPDGYLVEVEQV